MDPAVMIADPRPADADDDAENIIKANSSEETKVEIFLNINFLLFPS